MFRNLVISRISIKLGFYTEAATFSRILIARAVCSKRKILIMDEATSALDNITQKHVADALANLKCTRIVVAHRLSTVKHCDRILVLDKGIVAESGTYEELIAKNGIFAELVERQRLEGA